MPVFRIARSWSRAAHLHLSARERRADRAAAHRRYRRRTRQFLHVVAVAAVADDPPELSDFRLPRHFARPLTSWDVI